MSEPITAWKTFLCSFSKGLVWGAKAKADAHIFIVSVAETANSKTAWEEGILSGSLEGSGSIS